MIQNNLIDDLRIKWTRIQQAMQQINADGCLLTVDVHLMRKSSIKLFCIIFFYFFNLQR